MKGDQSFGMLLLLMLLFSNCLWKLPYFKGAVSREMVEWNYMCLKKAGEKFCVCLIYEKKNQ